VIAMGFMVKKPPKTKRPPKPPSQGETKIKIEVKLI
jgi:hypothetical protein